MIRQTGQRDPGANSPFNSSKGAFGNPPLMTTENCDCNGSTKSSSTVSQNVVGYKAPSGGKSPAVAKPARMRNR